MTNIRNKNTFSENSTGKAKGKVHLRTCHEHTEGELRYSSTLSLTFTLDVVGWLAPCPI
jgi:hypothetical protein